MKSQYEIALDCSADEEQPEGELINVQVYVLKWPTAEVLDGQPWQPRPKWVAKEIEARLRHKDLDTSWTVGWVCD